MEFCLNAGFYSLFEMKLLNFSYITLFMQIGYEIWNL